MRGHWRADEATRPTRQSRQKASPDERPDRAAQHAVHGRHGYYDHELENPQPFEVDVELVLNLQPAGVDDDLEKTIDYGRVYAIARQIVESTSFRLLEGIAEAISHEILAAFEVTEVGVRVRKPERPARRAARLRRGRDLAAALRPLAAPRPRR